MDLQSESCDTHLVGREEESVGSRPGLRFVTDLLCSLKHEIREAESVFL